MTATATATTTFAQTLAGMEDPYNQESLAEAKRVFAAHEMSVLHSDGVYRHLRFAEPGSSFFHFDVHTSPGVLMLTGDIGTYVFARVPDMLSFFRHPYVNLGYWAEKLRAPESVTEYDPDLMRAELRRNVEAQTEGWEEASVAQLWATLDADLEDVADFRDLTIQTLMDFQYEDRDTGRVVTFTEPYEWNMTGYRSQYVLACHGLRAAAIHYLATGGQVTVGD